MLEVRGWKIRTQVSENWWLSIKTTEFYRLRLRRPKRHLSILFRPKKELVQIVCARSLMTSLQLNRG